MLECFSCGLKTDNMYRCGSCILAKYCSQVSLNFNQNNILSLTIINNFLGLPTKRMEFKS